MRRRDARILAMQVLYAYDFNQITIEEVLQTVMVEDDPVAKEMVFHCYRHLTQVDELIEGSLENYHMNRLNLVDKAILRLAVSEMLTDQPRNIIINEALEITKQFSDQGDHKATAFNNRLLDKINKKLKQVN